MGTWSEPFDKLWLAGKDFRKWAFIILIVLLAGAGRVLGVKRLLCMSGGSALGANLSGMEREGRCCEKLFGETLDVIHLDRQKHCPEACVGSIPSLFLFGNQRQSFIPKSD